MIERQDSYRDPRDVETVLAEVDYLPVAMLRDLIREEIRVHPNFVLVGETGSGKTTCLPPLLMEYRDELGLIGKIAVTQPRRFVTRSVSARVADIFGCDIGETVGYQVRYENITSDETDITFMTDGILLRQIQYDQYLRDYCIVMVDEAHERSLNIDLSLGLLKDVNLRRTEVGMEPIHIIISSATIEQDKFAQYIGNGDPENSINIPGRMFPVEVFYEKEIPPDFDYIKGAAEKVKEILSKNRDRDILVFMPGKPEINQTILQLQFLIGNLDVDVYPLHAELSPEEQDKIYEPSLNRKVIVATNIAETGFTPERAVDVIDTGLIKQIQYDAKTGIEQLVLIEHSISGIDQRAGRAGRTDSGECHRLFTEESLAHRPRFQTPEIQRSNLAQVVLTMKKVGIQDIDRFGFIDPPRREALRNAVETLTLLGALDDNEEITSIGEFMVDLGIEPRLGRMVIEAIRPDLNCLNEICIISAFMEGKTVFVSSSDPIQKKAAEEKHFRFKDNKESDFEVILDIWKGYVNSGYDPNWAIDHYLNEKVLEEVKNLRLELIEVLTSHKIYIDPIAKPKFKDAIGIAITAGLIGNLMNTKGKTFKKVDGTKDGIFVHPDSIFAHKGFKENTYIVSEEIFINPYDKAFACKCQIVRPDWIAEVAPSLYEDLFTRKGRGRGKQNKHNFGGRKNKKDSYNNHSRRGR